MQHLKTRHLILATLLAGPWLSASAAPRDEFINDIYTTAQGCWSGRFSEKVIVEKQESPMGTIISARKEYGSFGKKPDAFIAIIIDSDGQHRVMEGLSGISRSGSFSGDVNRWLSGDLACRS